MLDQILNNPDLLNTLTPDQQISVYQQLQQRRQNLEAQKLKAQTQLDLKRQEQQDLLQQLQQLTNKTNIQEIRDYITNQQQEFSTKLKDLVQQFQKFNS